MPDTDQQPLTALPVARDAYGSLNRSKMTALLPLNVLATEVQNGRRTAHHHGRAFLPRDHRSTVDRLLPALGGEPFDGLELLVDFRFGRSAAG